MAAAMPGLHHWHVSAYRKKERSTAARCRPDGESTATLFPLQSKKLIDVLDGNLRE
jgi:hypothetical protein